MRACCRLKVLHRNPIHAACGITVWCADGAVTLWFNGVIGSIKRRGTVCNVVGRSGVSIPKLGDSDARIGVGMLRAEHAGFQLYRELSCRFVKDLRNFWAVVQRR